jgi:hypothetical protein
MNKLYMVKFNISGEIHTYYRHGTEITALNYAIRKMADDCEISYAKAKGLKYEICEVDNG